MKKFVKENKIRIIILTISLIVGFSIGYSLGLVIEKERLEKIQEEALMNENY